MCNRWEGQSLRDDVMDAFRDINCQCSCRLSHGSHCNNEESCGIFSTPGTNFGILLLLFQVLNPRDEISFSFVHNHSTIWTNFGIRLLLFQVLNPNWNKGCIGC